MTSLTLTPEVRAYATAVSLVYALGCMAVSAHIHARWLARRRVDFAVAHCAVLTLLVAWLLATTDLAAALRWSPAPGVAAALVAGLVATKLDRLIVRRALRLRTRRKGVPLGDGPTARQPVRVTPLGVPGSLARQRAIGPQKMQERMNPYPRGMRLAVGPLVAAAALEELVFRGFLVRAALRAPGPWLAAAAVFASVAAFALSHVFFGWVHVFAKLPLSALATAALLVSGSVVPAILAHVVFNLLVYVDQLRVVPAAAVARRVPS